MALDKVYSLSSSKVFLMLSLMIPHTILSQTSSSQVSKLTILCLNLQVTGERFHCLTLLLVSFVKLVSLHGLVVLRVAHFPEFFFSNNLGPSGLSAR